MPAASTESSLTGSWDLAASRLLSLEGGRQARDAHSVVALSGVLAGSASVEDLMKGWPPGHYSAVRAADGELTLYRDAFGMARLYYALKEGRVLFATDARALPRAGLDAEAALEAVLSADLDVIFGDLTLHAGVREVPPGEALVFSRSGLRRVEARDPYLEPWDTGPSPSPKELRARLSRAVGLAIGGERRVGVALSGGVDSAMIAAMAAEHLGPGAVTAFTYEFDEPSHPNETPFAALAAKALGIEHRVVRVAKDAYRASLPELFRLLEAPRLAPGAWLAMSRALGEAGLERVLTGDGMELALSLTEEFELGGTLGLAAQSVPWPDLTLKLWKLARFGGWRLRGPGLPGRFEPPGPTLYHMLLCVLRHNGLISDVGAFYPASLAATARRAAESPRVRDAVRAHAADPLDLQLRRHRLRPYYLQRLWRGKQTAWREAGGAYPVCPALLLEGAPMPRRKHWANNRELHHMAVEGLVPREILLRKKVTNQSILPSAWSRDFAAELSPKIPAVLAKMSLEGPPAAELSKLFPRELALLGLWCDHFA